MFCCIASDRHSGAWLRLILLAAVCVAGGSLIDVGVSAAPRSVVPDHFAGTQSEKVTCDEAIIGSGHHDWRRISSTVGPFALPAFRFRFAYRSSSDGLFHSKLMALVVGHDPITVTVPARLVQRVGLEYGYRNDYKVAASVTFFPCPDKPRTIWPGGLVFERREPLALAVASSRPLGLLHLGRIGDVPAAPVPSFPRW